jgi:hypothetical protein
METLIARLRAPSMWLFLAAVVAAVAFGITVWISIGLFVVALALNFWLGTVRADPVTVRAPVEGRWLAMNSPADHVPSHYLHTYGQTYAIDFVHEPVDRARPGFEWWPPTRSAKEFPGFGQEVLAPAAGAVVKAHNRERDHRSRNSPLGFLLLFLEMSVRELLGTGRVLGNHVILDLGGGVYAVLAHLRRGSMRVDEGERVRPGEPVAECGNSGNSSEPHLHFQLMDSEHVLFAAGLPLEFDRFELAGSPQRGVPGKGPPFVAPSSA